ncbi:MAG: nitroreductase family protein [Coriobacteriia bacterium]|nr:nitroreductase family protein [Coriobacteriia bacterium]
MLTNEVIETIMVKRRSFKLFDGKPLSDEVIETILECGKIAPTGMNRQPWHFTVVKTAEAMAELGADLLAMQAKRAGAGQAGNASTEPRMTASERTRNAPLMIIASGDENEMCAHIDTPLAMENMLLAAASLGVDSGWDFSVNRDFFEGTDGPANKAKYQIPEGYKAYCACYFGYRDASQAIRDRGPRREGTVTVL